MSTDSIPAKDQSTPFYQGCDAYDKFHEDEAMKVEQDIREREPELFEKIEELVFVYGTIAIREACDLIDAEAFDE
jgi:hypothetical protein